MRTSERPFPPVDVDLVCKIIEKFPDTVFTITPDGVIQYVNESFSNILGYLKEEVIGRNILEIAVEESIYNT
ncbi:MAG: PAS domain-containing protein [Hydrogenothermaceae bacterium]|nr:PAS domain-containing protein [Hydrogenothermaceae bacterium]